MLFLAICFSKLGTAYFNQHVVHTLFLCSSLQADDEDGMLRDRPSLQAKKLSSQSSLERRSVGGFLHRKSSLTGKF